MSKISFSVPKALARGIVFALICIPISGIAITQILKVLPFTPEHQADEFLGINHYSAVAYATSYIQQLQRSSSLVDAFIATPITLVLSGAVFALNLPRETWPMRRVLRSGLFTGFGMIIGIILLTWGLVLREESLSGQPLAQIDIHTMHASDWLISLGQILSSALAFALGALLGALCRRRSSTGASKSRVAPDRIVKPA